MGVLVLRGLRARKRRALTITGAIFLGVALMSGSFVLTDTINRSFEDIFEEGTKGTDVVVRPREEVRSIDRRLPPALDASLLERVRRTPGVEVAQGGIFSLARIVDKFGRPIGPEFAPNFVASTGIPRFESFSYRGRKPRFRWEATLDTQTAERGGLRIGGQFAVVGEGGTRRYRIVGLSKLGDTSFGGASVASLELPEAKRITAKQGKLDQISVAAEEGVTPSTLEQRMRDRLPSAADVATAQEDADRQSRQIKEELSFLTIALLVFAGVSLFVGGFVIFNTFSITVAQRIREFGLLRTLGASRRQLLGAVLLEASIVGVIGSASGLAGGIGFAPAINALFEWFGIDLPNTGTVVATRTIVVSLAVGMAVTLASALAPALRATRVSPMAALREAALPGSRRRGPLLFVLAGMLCTAGVALALVGLFAEIDSSGTAAALMGGGAAAVLFGVALLSPRLVKPLAALAGRPIERLRGLTGRLARENATRKPARTAATAAALMIGLALVTFVAVFADGINASTDRAVDRTFAGDLVIQNLDGFSPIPPAIARSTERLRGVATVSSLIYGTAEVGGIHGDHRLSGLEPGTAHEVLKLDWERGSPSVLRDLDADEAVVDAAWAGKEEVSVGDRLRVTAPSGRRRSYRVRGSVTDNADLFGSFVIAERAFHSHFRDRQPSQIYVVLEQGARPKVVQGRIKRLLKFEFPVAAVRDQDQLKDAQSEQVGQLVSLVYALLSLAIVVSLFGIVNTLALSIHERTRELGLLRAVGMTRRQVRTVIRYEAVITALIGAVLGMGLGLAFAALVARPLADEGFTISYPLPTLAALLLLSAIAGVVAAIGPARRASNLDVLDAVAYE